MKKYTFRSTSNEGVYYLINGWNKHKTFWIAEADVNRDIEKAKNKFFNKPAHAKANLVKLLKVMEEYRGDKFDLIEFE